MSMLKKNRKYRNVSDVDPILLKGDWKKERKRFLRKYTKVRKKVYYYEVIRTLELYIYIYIVWIFLLF